MYRISVAFVLFVLPLCSILIAHFMQPGVLVMALVVKWFVFWVVGVRVFLAGVVQLWRPGFTAQQIFSLKSNDVLPLVREIGMGNLAGGLVGLLSIAFPTFVLPIAIWGAVYYGGAGLGHMARSERSANESFALLTDLYAFAVLAVVVAWTFLTPAA
jgi:hypothetical protein